MSEISLSLTIQGDDEGYITFSCPYFHSDFKLQAGELQDEDEPFVELFCPYCGLTKQPNDFYSDEVIEQAKARVANYMIEELNKSLEKIKHSVNRGNNIIKISYKPLEKANIKELKEQDTQEVAFECGICNHHVKVLYCDGVSKIFCPYCGVDI